MENFTLLAKALHLTEDQMLSRSRWYGPNLFTFIITSEETNGSFSLIKNLMGKGFEPPLHVHTLEDESHYLLAGEIIYEVGGKQIHAKRGDFVYLPKNIPHRFKVGTETAEFLLLITPGGFEKLFKTFSRPAERLALPPMPPEQPNKEFFIKMKEMNEALGVTFLPEP